MCGWGWGGNAGGWGSLVMYTVLAAVLVAVAVAVAFAIRGLIRGGSQHKEASSAATGPEDVLAQRFACGEIDEDEYRRRIAIVREHREHI